MARRASIDGRVLLLRHMSGRPPCPDVSHAIPGIVTAVAPAFGASKPRLGVPALPLLGRAVSWVDRENGGVEAALQKIHIQVLAVEQVVLDLLAEGTFAMHRVQGDQQ